MPGIDTQQTGLPPEPPAAGPADALSAIEMLAGLLNHIEMRPDPNPDQYLVVVRRLESALQGVAMSPKLKAILMAYPSAAELYENLHYGHAGLCLHDLDKSLATEQRARQVMTQARGGVTGR